MTEKKLSLRAGRKMYVGDFVGMDDAEPCIFLPATDLFNETVLLCLGALELGLTRDGTEGKDERTRRIVASGMVLAAEAWKRGLISAPKPS